MKSALITLAILAMNSQAFAASTTFWIGNSYLQQSKEKQEPCSLAGAISPRIPVTANGPNQISANVVTISRGDINYGETMNLCFQVHVTNGDGTTSDLNNGNKIQLFSTDVAHTPNRKYKATYVRQEGQNLIFAVNLQKYLGDGRARPEGLDFDMNVDNGMTIPKNNRYTLPFYINYTNKL